MPWTITRLCIDCVARCLRSIWNYGVHGKSGRTRFSEGFWSAERSDCESAAELDGLKLSVWARKSLTSVAKRRIAKA